MADISASTAVDEYLAAVPEATRATLEKLRSTIRAAAPSATETISYGMPTFRLRGRYLISYAAFKDHCSLFPATQNALDAYGEELMPFFSGKGTLRFTVEKPIPSGLVRRIVKMAVAENDAAARA